jgi:hypothetical protein
MEASELRDGNLTQDIRGVVFEVDINSRLRYFQAKSPAIQDAIFNPIPLTEEWLLRFGFTYKKTDKANCYTLHFFSVNFVTDGGYKGKFFIRIANFNPDINNFLYVHQLQNLYHSLTGKELDHGR